MRCFLAVLTLTLFLGCSRRPAAPAGGEPSLRIAVVTDLKGYLEPCGCTSNPLGGIDRLAAQIEALHEKSVPVLFVMAGDLFFDTAELEPARVDQAERNAKTLAGILNRLGVNAVLPGPNDRAQPEARLAPIRGASEFPWLAMNGDAEALRVHLGDLGITLVGVPPNANRDPVRTAVTTATGESDLTLVLLHGSRRDANRIGANEAVDFLIHGGLDQDEPVPPRRAGKAWAFHASRQGQGLTVVDVYRKKKDGPFVDRSEWSKAERAAQLDRQLEELASKIAVWEKSGEVDAADLGAQRERLNDLKARRQALDVPMGKADANAFSARFVELPKSAPRDGQIEKLMRAHDKVVNDANRKAFAGLEPPPLGPDDVAYLGSQACSPCHQTAYTWWRNHAHGLAYLTLQQRSKEFNLDCVACHVTGYEQPGGSTVTHNLEGALVNVGCESCHGPGAAHAKDPEVPIVRIAPESVCVACHNDLHSDLFEYEEYRKTLTVPGHGLPQVTH